MEELVRALSQARTSGVPLRAADWTDAVRDEQQAYAVQQGVAARLGWGAPPLYWKAGGASAQGPFSHSPLDPAGIGHVDGRWPLLGIEAEVALRIGSDGEPDAMALAIELVSTRWVERLDAPALLRTADHQSHGALLLGPWQPWKRLDWNALEWRLSWQDAAPIERRGGLATGDPAAPLPALRRHVGGLRAGTVVTTGAWHGMQPWGAAPQATMCIELRMDGLGALVFRAA